MTRISTLAQNPVLLRNNLTNQERLFDLQRQIGSGEDEHDPELLTRALAIAAGGGDVPAELQSV